MSKYFEGYAEAKEEAKNATLDQMLFWIDSLFGRNNLNYGDSESLVRIELLRQIKKDFTVI